MAAQVASLCGCIQGVAGSGGDGVGYVDAAAVGGADGARIGAVASAALPFGGCAADLLHVAAAVEGPNGRGLSDPGC